MSKKTETPFLTRRQALKQCLYCSLGFTALSYDYETAPLHGADISAVHPADFWRPLPDSRTECLLCPNKCIRDAGKNGLCRSRGNRGGKLYSLTYARPAVIALDYVEKTPLHHFQVKGRVFSIATAGCNMRCRFCQNWQFSQSGPNEVKETFYLPPEEVIKRAKKHDVDTISFFYTDPVVYYEYMMDIAALAKNNHMKTVCVTAGYINEEPLLKLIPKIDAFVIGLKGFTNSFYRKYIGGRLEPVKDTIRILSSRKKETWFEVVNLLIPGINDDSKSLQDMTRWLASRAGKEVPLHFTRFEPAYRMKKHPATPHSSLKKAYTIAKQSGLEHIYIGNLPGVAGQNTVCPRCGRILIERLQFKVIKNIIKDGKCPCGQPVPGRWIQ